MQRWFGNQQLRSVSLLKNEADQIQFHLGGPKHELLASEALPRRLPCDAERHCDP